MRLFTRVGGGTHSKGWWHQRWMGGLVVCAGPKPGPAIMKAKNGHRGVHWQARDACMQCKNGRRVRACVWSSRPAAQVEMCSRGLHKRCRLFDRVATGCAKNTQPVGCRDTSAWRRRRAGWLHRAQLSSGVLRRPRPRGGRSQDQSGRRPAGEARWGSSSSSGGRLACASQGTCTPHLSSGGHSPALWTLYSTQQPARNPPAHTRRA